MTIASYTPSSGSEQTAPGPTGPDSAGTNPAPSTVSANTLNPAIASKALPGGGEVGATAATPAKPLDEKQIVDELAKALEVKATKTKPLEVAVADALSEKYGVKVEQIKTTTSGTGTGQGEVGQVRHNIASWFSSALSTVGNAVGNLGAGVTGGGGPDDDKDAALANAMKIQSPKLREQAIAKIQKQYNDFGTPPQLPEPIPVESKKALDEMLTQVAQKVGVANAGPDALSDIAKTQGLPTQTPGTPATPGGTQTAGEAYQTFVKELSDTKTAAKFAAQVVPRLEAAGLLDENATNAAKQSNGTTYTNAQIANAYQSVLAQQVNANQSEAEALTALASNTSTPGAPTSEMYAYVQGVAQEFGVGLTNQQLTAIANTYGANATTAGDPSSVEDEIKDSVVALFDPTNPTNPAGIASTAYTDIQQQALAYQIPISAAQIGNMVKQGLQGATVESAFIAADSIEAAATKQFQSQAQGLYPALSAQIAAGNTVQTLVSPYFNVAESITGVPASTMMAEQQTGGLSKWSAFLQGGNNPAGATKTAPGTSPTGSAAQAGPQMMTLDQWKTYLMQNPTYGFQNTQGAKDMAEQMSSAILNEFGKVNTASVSSDLSQLGGSSDLSANAS